MVSRYRALPSVNDVLSDPRIAELIDKYSHEAIVDIVREELDGARSLISAGGEPPVADALTESVAAKAESEVETLASKRDKRDGGRTAHKPWQGPAQQQQLRGHASRRGRLQRSRV